MCQSHLAPKTRRKIVDIGVGSVDEANSTASEREVDKTKKKVQFTVRRPTWLSQAVPSDRGASSLRRISVRDF